jgi:tRNA pseudouridine32 synthase/23S rRNA pseudouridine746 synthase
MLAAEQVKSHISSRPELEENARRGKMLGVLVVERQGQLGFLAAYSGLLAGRNDWPWFVPPVFDAQQPDGHFKQTEHQISAINQEIRQLESASSPSPLIPTLKERRKQMSEELQLWLFRQYRMLNAQGEEKDLVEIWRDYHASPRLRKRFPLPPGGTGDCCAPKLLQHAFSQGLKPISMAEFWYGESPNAEIRHHAEFYPACRGKCLPVLTWMLGLDRAEVSAHCGTTADAAGLKEIYSDDAISVVVKPAGMLSVPGKTDAPSVYSMMRQRYPLADSPLIVHRLDMATSGLLVIAKTRQAYHQLQEQFRLHEVKKKYVALLDGHVEGSGTISLPLRPNPLDRPRQVVDHELGKQALTRYEVISADEHSTRIALYPQTGRTHQLRMHCAHAEGLNSPIRGDELYGHKADRLFLHAEEICFTHPLTGQPMSFHSEADF